MIEFYKKVYIIFCFIQILKFKIFYNEKLQHEPSQTSPLQFDNAAKHNKTIKEIIVITMLATPKPKYTSDLSQSRLKFCK